MLVTAKELRRVRGKMQISQPLFYAYALLYAEALHTYFGLEAQITRSMKTNTVYIVPPDALMPVRIADHSKRGRHQQVIISGRHPKGDDLAQLLDEAFRRCYSAHRTPLDWKEIAKRFSVEEESA